MIPKVIHYCWFGGSPLSELAERCLHSWKAQCPDYELVRWDESNCAVSQYLYAQQAYEAQKWGFVSDVVRLQVLYEHGGIYLDTDVELLKPLDAFLDNAAFIGFESNEYVNSGSIFAAHARHPLLRELLDVYTTLRMRNADGTLNTTPSPFYTTQVLVAHGLRKDNSLQTLADITVYPTDYFCPKDVSTGLLRLTDHTHALHHFDGSWLSDESKLLNRMRAAIYRCVGTGALATIPVFLAKNVVLRIYTIQKRIKTDGFKALCIYYAKKYMLKSKDAI